MRDAAASDPAAAVTATPMPLDRQLRTAALASVAMAVPERVVTNATVAEHAGVTEQWIVHRTGVHERRHVSEGERLQDLATAAGRQALDDAGVQPEDVDLVLVATLAADELTPNAAPLVAHDLGAVKAGAMDVGSACTGFLSGLQLATAQVEGGRADNVLLIGADVLSRYIDPTDRGTAALFADGAGAAVVAPAGEGQGRIGDILLRCDGSGRDSIKAGDQERIIHMQGHDTFKSAVLRMSEATRRLGRARGPRARRRSTCSSTTRRTRASSPRWATSSASTRPSVVNSIDRYGNTSSATLPIALADARERGMLQPGMNVLLSAFGAGFTWGAGVIEWAA